MEAVGFEECFATERLLGAGWGSFAAGVGVGSGGAGWLGGTAVEVVVGGGFMARIASGDGCIAVAFNGWDFVSAGEGAWLRGDVDFCRVAVGDTVCGGGGA